MFARRYDRPSGLVRGADSFSPSLAAPRSRKERLAITPHRPRIGRALALATLAGAALIAAAPAAAVNASQPTVALDQTFDGFASYLVIARATTTVPHTRSEGSVRHRCASHESWVGTRFIADGGPRTQFTTPPILVALPDGHRCEIQVDWLISGGGSPGETGVSPVKVVDTTIVRVRPRYKPATKQSARNWRNAAHNVASRYHLNASGGASNAGWYVLEAVARGYAAAAERIADDPPDSRFRTRVVLANPAPAHIGVDAAGSAATAIDGLIVAGTKATSAGVAMVKAIDKAQGAFRSRASDRKRWEKRQMLDAAGFARRYATALDTFRTKSVTAAAALTAAGVDASTRTFAAADLDASRTGLLFDGLAAPVAAELTRLKVPADLIAATPMRLALALPTLTLTLPEAMTAPALLSAQRAMANRMRTWATYVKNHPLGAG